MICEVIWLFVCRYFFFSSRRRHTRFDCDWSSDVCSSDLLFFYFLGDVTPELEAYTGRLAETYEANVQFRKFTETLIEGCGPGCGTEDVKEIGRASCRERV